MNSDRFFCMQSQQARITDRDRYNKSTCANCTVTKISLAASVQLSISEPRLLMRGRTSELLNLKTSRHTLETYLLVSYNPCNLRIIVKLFSPPRDLVKLFPLVIFPN